MTEKTKVEDNSRSVITDKTTVIDVPIVFIIRTGRRLNVNCLHLNVSFFKIFVEPPTGGVSDQV